MYPIDHKETKQDLIDKADKDDSDFTKLNDNLNELVVQLKINNALLGQIVDIEPTEDLIQQGS